MSSTPLAPSVNYKLLQTWEEEDGGEDEEDLNLHQNGNGNHKNYVTTTIQDYLQSLNRPDVEGYQNGRRRNVWPSHGNKRGLLAALGVAVVLMVLLVSVVVYVNKHDDSSSSSEVDEKHKHNQRLVAGKADAKTITLTDILQNTYGYKGSNASWISDDEIQYFDNLGNLRIYNVDKDVAEYYITASQFEEGLSGSRPFEVVLSQDKQFALVGYDSQKVYRHSFYAKYSIFSKEHETFEQIKVEGDDIQHHLLQLVQWAPQTNAIAFVYENDVYYRPSPNPGTPNKRVTHTGGITSIIFQGITDWVYEEEMFGTFRALWFSPDGHSFAFATFNDTNVRQIQYTLYGTPGQFPQSQYPVLESIAYPKSGTENPTVKISIATNLDDMNGPKIQEANIGTGEISHYVGTVFWPTSSELLVVTLNRHQNELSTLLCSNVDANCNQIFGVKQQGGWLDVNTPVASKDGQTFLMLHSVSQGTGSPSYKHIVRFDKASGTQTPVTTGHFSVDSISGWDETNNKIFFTSTGYNQTTSTATPSQTHLFTVEPSTSVMSCLTCGIHNADQLSPCLVNSVSLSKQFKHMIHTCSGPAVPEVVIRSVEGIDAVKLVWESNDDLKNKLQDVALPIIQDYDIKLVSGFTAKARLWLPPNYDTSKKYPLFVDVYGGPGSQKITEKFLVDWGTSLATSRDVIYASIDGRGSGRQSDDLMYQIYRKMGTVEIEDQIAAAKWLIENNKDNVIDANRTAIWGWSYGGYATAMVMGTDVEGIFKCGISVAPVTSWMFYDTIYTERYMGLPIIDDNLSAYNSSDVTNHIQNFRTKKYYLIHGNADDNVHYQQSMILSRALEKADILFRQQSYPDENHGLGSVRRHLYHSLEDFLFEECF